MSLDRDGAYQCDGCPLDVRVERRCPKLVHGQEEDQRALQAKMELPPAPELEEACPRLHAEAVENDREAQRWLADYGDYSRGALARRGGIEDQPLRWLEAQRLIDATVNDWKGKQFEKGRETTPKAPTGMSVDPEFAPLPPVRPAYGTGKRKKKKEGGDD